MAETRIEMETRRMKKKETGTRVKRKETVTATRAEKNAVDAAKGPAEKIVAEVTTTTTPLPATIAITTAAATATPVETPTTIIETVEILPDGVPLPAEVVTITIIIQEDEDDPSLAALAILALDPIVEEDDIRPMRMTVAVLTLVEAAAYPAVEVIPAVQIPKSAVLPLPNRKLINPPKTSEPYSSAH
jgi:hypothetical protein